MQGWETVLAAVGGLVLGLGIGLGWGRRAERRLTRRLRAVHSRIRTAILPVLESRADTLGVGRSPATLKDEDPLEQAVELSTRIGKREPSDQLAYSDTVEVDRRKLQERDGGV